VRLKGKLCHALWVTNLAISLTIAGSCELAVAKNTTVKVSPENSRSKNAGGKKTDLKQLRGMGRRTAKFGAARINDTVHFGI
jgi:hypothetical protein